MNRRTPAAIVLADGSTFEGEAIGQHPEGGVTTGEFVFNTVLSGYQEVISDPSYAGQVITFTYPHIGNYGVNPGDDEAARPHCRGVVMRDLARRASNHRSEGSLGEWLEHHGVPGIVGVDTRRLTRHLRDHGAVPGAFGPAPPDELEAAARSASGTDGRDLVAEVSEPQGRTISGVEGAQRRIIALDLGLKNTIVDQLRRLGPLEVLPSTTTADDLLAREPDGIFVSNGPGDPAAVDGVVATVRGLLGEVPVFGICMGQQMLAQAIGGGTYKLPFGHHGGNHPVKDLATGRIEITSQNHNYCVDPDTLSGATVTHVNLNDGTLEGFECTEVPAFAVQYHPEAGPGPHDSRYLFARFAELIDRKGRR
ncbi:MAG: glutamine-hydrolyzing carbamoyl-phosphate synthase small subunit [Microthrixaceae bacterium]